MSNNYDSIDEALSYIEDRTPEHHRELNLTGLDRYLTDVGRYPDEGEEEFYYEPFPRIRNERDVCSVCKFEYGGTVGNPAEMTVVYFVCRRCQQKAREQEVA